MAGAPEWTSFENLAIYMFLEKYPHKSSENIADEIFNNSFLKNNFFIHRKNVDTIKQHVDLLRKPEYHGRLFIPDYKNLK
ncbi:hypothetical protein SAMN05720606_11850 [Paenibacillus polysaccharolyticus]|uniref:Uncharacterized protein n=1 Tax=Paenibacillus polysaccharolyticus TaxID=582692 RepID=A0A1G5L0N4_9BACL|nr:hypothetical protein [Paenibacillus polysaccharolyticus]SCZ05908.1 hypothetical protein SAMN05720606_11850 [Paenibacillus polysaccharolyticus]